MSSSAYTWWAERLNVKSAFLQLTTGSLRRNEPTSVAGKCTLAVRNDTMKHSFSLNIEGRRKRSKGIAKRSAAFGVLLSLGFLNLAAAVHCSSLYSRRCCCYGEDALLWPHSPWYKLVILGAYGPRCINPVETYTS